MGTTVVSNLITYQGGVPAIVPATTTQAQVASVVDTVPGVEMGMVPFTTTDLALLLLLQQQTAALTSTIPPGALTLEQFAPAGTVFDGNTDATPFWQAALAQCAASASIGGGFKTIALGANRAYPTTTQQNVPAMTAIIGQGNSSLVPTTADINVFRVAGDDVLFQNFKIQANSTGANQIGIANQPVGSAPASGFHRVRVVNVTFSQLATAGMLTYQLPGAPPYFTTYAVNPRCEHCGIGLWFLGEYSCVLGMQIDSCGVGVEVEGGNQIYLGGSITSCTIAAVQLDGGGNDGHGVFTSIEANHNAKFLKCTGTLANGYLFRGCEIYDGAIECKSTNGLVFDACQIDAPLSHDGSTGTRYVNCQFPTPQAYGGTIVNNANGNASTTQFINPTDQSGNVPAFITAGNDGSAIAARIPMATKRGPAASGGGTFVVTLVPGTDIPSNGTLRIAASVLLDNGTPITDAAGLPTQVVVKLAAGVASLPANVTGSANPSAVGTQNASASTAGFVGGSPPTAVFSISGGNLVLTVTNQGATAATAQVVFDAHHMI